MSPASESFVALPRGLTVRLMLQSSSEALTAVVRAVSSDHLTLGVLDVPTAESNLKGQKAGLVAQIHGRTYELDATIVGVETTPPGLVTTLPVEARRQQRRNFYRLNVSIRARAAWREPDEDNEGEFLVHDLRGAQLLDVGGGGAQVRAADPVPLGATMTLEFSLEAGAPPIQVNARALTCRAEERTHAYRINTQFVGIDRRTQERIVRFIYQEQTRLTGRRSA
ncbi:MAG: PilZ domain-containing protein [Dehalococcoidia bacterium]